MRMSVPKEVRGSAQDNLQRDDESTQPDLQEHHGAVVVAGGSHAEYGTCTAHPGEEHYDAEAVEQRVIQTFAMDAAGLALRTSELLHLLVQPLSSFRFG